MTTARGPAERGLFMTISSLMICYIKLMDQKKKGWKKEKWRRGVAY